MILKPPCMLPQPLLLDTLSRSKATEDLLKWMQKQLDGLRKQIAQKENVYSVIQWMHIMLINMLIISHIVVPFI